MASGTSGIQMSPMSTNLLPASGQSSVETPMLAGDQQVVGILRQPEESQLATENQHVPALVDDPSFDVEQAIQQVLGENNHLMDLPANVERVIEKLKPMKKDISTMAVRLRRPKSDFCEERLWKSLAAFLYYMHNLEVVDPKMKTTAKFGAVLELVFNPSHKFPALYAQIAKHIYDDLEAINWGAEPVPSEDEDELEAAGTTGNASASARNRASIQSVQAHLPADNDPIYGLNGIMHHILRINGPKVMSYQINPTYRSRNAKVFGHNGITVGDCWPMQMASLRDGAHGQRMGGISGTMDDGAYSIVISGIYDDLDKDEGDRLYYSGSNSHENTSSVPVTSQKTKALERSIETRRPVRVFRTSEGSWTYRPSAGIRYDGLYTVTEVNIEQNGRHGAYKRFTLIRRSGQPNIQVHAPSYGLQSLFARVKDGYARAPLRQLPAQ